MLTPRDTRYILELGSVLETQRERKSQMKRRFTYHITYILDGDWDISRGIDVVAESKEDAYEKAVFEVLPAEMGRCPYSAWVDSVTYSNGNRREFNTGDGNAY